MMGPMTNVKKWSSIIRGIHKAALLVNAPDLENGKHVLDIGTHDLDNGTKDLDNETKDLSNKSGIN